MKELEEKQRELEEERSADHNEDFFSMDEVEDVLRDKLPDLPADLIQEIAERLFG